jgi:hypothetical protein
MSQIKITNSIFNICLGDARGKILKKKTILITDSKCLSTEKLSLNQNSVYMIHASYGKH